MMTNLFQPAGFRLNEDQMRSIFINKSPDEFELTINGRYFRFLGMISGPGTISYSFTSEKEDRANGEILKFLLEGKEIGITSQNANFLREVGEALYIKELVDLAQGCLNNNLGETLIVSYFKWICSFILIILCSAGRFGKILLSLWDLSGVVVLISILFNLFVTWISASLYYIEKEFIVSFLFVLLPLTVYSLFFLNLILIPIYEVFMLRIFLSNSFFVKHQELFMKFIKVLPIGRSVEKEKYCNDIIFGSIYGIFFLILISSFVFQMFSPTFSHALEVILYIFGIIIPSVKYISLLFFYFLHCMASMFQYCRLRYREMDDFDDHFLNAIYFRNNSVHDLYMLLIIKKTENESNSMSDLTQCDDINEPSIKFSIILKAIFSRNMASLYVIVSLMVHMFVSFLNSDGNRLTASQIFSIIFLYVVFIMPIATFVSFPFFWIRRLKDRPMSKSMLEKERAELRSTKKYLEYSQNILIWGTGTNSSLRWLSSIVCIFLILFLSCFTIIALFLLRDLVGNDTEPTTSRNIQDYTQLYNITSSLCDIEIYGINVFQLGALARVSYLDTSLDNVSSDLSACSYFEPENQSCSKKGDPCVRIIDCNNTRIFSIRGTVNIFDVLADIQLWFSSFIQDIIIPILPFFKFYMSEGRAFMGVLMSAPRLVFKQFSIIDSYINDISGTIVNNIDSSISTMIIVGHSLGGGLSKILSIQTGIKAFSISGPGIQAVTYTIYQNEDISFYQRAQNTFVNLVPDQDIVAKVDTVTVGTQFNIPCQAGFIHCHSLVRTLCTMDLMCGRTSTPNYCARFAKEIDDMRKISEPFNHSQ